MALPAIVFPLLLAVFGTSLTPVWLIWLLAVPAAWQAIYATMLNRLAHPKTA